MKIKLAMPSHKRKVATNEKRGSICFLASGFAYVDTVRVMKTLLFALLLWYNLTFAQDTNNPVRVEKGETWSSQSRLERIAKDYVKQQKIEFSFEDTEKSVSVQKRGTNLIATISFFAGFGKPVLEVEIIPSGAVLTNHLAMAVCGIGKLQ